MVELQYLLDRSEKQLEGVHATIANKAIELVKKAYNKGIAIAVTQGYRSIEYQNSLYAIGRFGNSGKKVTNAKGGSSYHNFGLAFDFCVFDDNKQPVWDGKEYSIIGQMGKDMGLEWGGDFKSIKDKPHFQITFGLTLSQLQAGKRPAGSATPTPVKKSNLLEKGASGFTVKDLQEKLIKLGYAIGKVDSEFGKLTDEAVRKFQKDNCLDADGIAGKATLAKIDELVKALTNTPTQAIKVEKAPATETKAEVIKAPPTPQKTTSGDDKVKSIQSRLNTQYATKLDVDGLYGKATKQALVKALQTELNKQYNAKLKVDGVFGKATKAKCPTVRKGAKGDITYVIQAALTCLGYDVNGLDGIYGAGLEKAVKQFQKAKGLSADGIVGKDTFEKLLG